MVVKQIVPPKSCVKLSNPKLFEEQHSKRNPSVCGGSELNTSHLKNKNAWNHSLCFQTGRLLRNIFRFPYEKSKDSPMHNSELRVHINGAFNNHLFFTRGTN